VLDGSLVDTTPRQLLRADPPAAGAIVPRTARLELTGLNSNDVYAVFAHAVGQEATREQCAADANKLHVADALNAMRTFIPLADTIFGVADCSGVGYLVPRAQTERGEPGRAARVPARLTSAYAHGQQLMSRAVLIVHAPERTRVAVAHKENGKE
jgi:hypothetical protein